MSLGLKWADGGMMRRKGTGKEAYAMEVNSGVYILYTLVMRERGYKKCGGV